MFFIGILHLLFFSFYKKLPSFFPLNRLLLHLSYCCIPKILNKLLQPTVPGLVPPHSLVFTPKTLLLRHPLQFFTHPLWFCFIYVFFLFSPALNLLPQSLHIKIILPLIPPGHSDNQVYCSPTFSVLIHHGIPKTVATTPRQDSSCAAL